jgi:CRISPR-associated protein Csm2
MKEEIKLWKDEKEKIVNPALFSDQAESLAKKIAQDHENSKGKKANKRTQLRKFYDEVLRLEMEARRQKWETVLPLLHMIIAKAAYARGRDLVSDDFVHFIRSSIKQVKRHEDLEIFSNFFEAFMGFYRMYGPSN